MQSDTIEAEWSELAKDDGTIVLDQPTYSVAIGGDIQTQIGSPASSVSFSPSVNKVKNLTVDVPPDTVLEGTTYLGEPLEFYVNGELAFEGKIKRVNTSQSEGKDYTIVAHPPGKRLAGSTVERNVDNEVVYDTVANSIDEFNGYDSDLGEKSGTADEGGTASHVGGDIRGGSGDATYNNVGSDASALSRVNLKIYTPSSVTVEISTSTNTYSEIFDTQTKNRYGEWVTVDPGSTFDADTGVYSITVSLGTNDLLIDWIAIIGERLRRQVYTPDVATTDSNVSLYSRSIENTDNEFGKSSKVLYDAGVGTTGGYRLKQTAAWDTMESGDFQALDDSTASGGGFQPVEGDAYDPEPDYGVSDGLSDWGIWVRGRYRPRVQADEDWSGFNNITESTNYAYSGSVSGYKLDADSAGDNLWEDADTSTSDYITEGYVYLPGGGSGYQVEIRMQASNGDWYEGVMDYLNNRIEVDDSGGNRVTTAMTLSRDTWYYFKFEWDEDNTDWIFTVGSTSVSATPTATGRILDGLELNGAESYWDGIHSDFSTASGGAYYEFSTTVDGTTLTYGAGFGVHDEWADGWGWSRLIEGTYEANWPDPYAGETVQISLSSPTTSFLFDYDASVIVESTGSWSSADFDNTLTNGYLDYPHIYAGTGPFGGQYVEFNENVSTENITESTVNASVLNSTNATIGWGPTQKIDLNASYYDTLPNSSTKSDDYPYVGVSHQMKFWFSPSGAARDTANPREGYYSMQLEDYSVTASHNDLEIIFDKSFSDNRLAEINSIASESSLVFRFEGDLARIFQRGQLKTNISLRSEDIESSVSIEDVYKTCEVVGLHDVRSGILTSVNAPSYVDEHKQIRVEDVLTKSDAVSRAKSFLRKHGDVKFKGKIETLPTFAPLGELVDGSLFNHGQDMIIRSVSYRKNKATIDFGYDKNVAGQLISLSTDTGSTKSRATDKGMVIPVGTDQYKS